MKLGITSDHRGFKLKTNLFKKLEEEYQIMVEYAESHNLSISQLIRLGVELQLKHQSNQ